MVLRGLQGFDGMGREEGWAQGGIIVQDCLEFLNNLLRGSPAHQLMFRLLQRGPLPCHMPMISAGPLLLLAWS